jgi:hypothetical protein
MECKGPQPALFQCAVREGREQEKCCRKVQLFRRWDRPEFWQTLRQEFRQPSSGTPTHAVSDDAKTIDLDYCRYELGGLDLSAAPAFTVGAMPMDCAAAEYQELDLKGLCLASLFGDGLNFLLGRTTDRF